ncbi:hypothetical protein Ancab_008625 [Ancistrocladus abbreviatus]
MISSCLSAFNVQVTKAFMAKQLQELKEEVRKEPLAVADKSLELLNFIDAIQCLGVAYHFEKEIEDDLQKVLGTFKGQNPEMNLFEDSVLHGGDGCVVAGAVSGSIGGNGGCIGALRVDFELHVSTVSWI